MKTELDPENEIDSLPRSIDQLRKNLMQYDGFMRAETLNLHKDALQAADMLRQHQESIRDDTKMVNSTIKKLAAQFQNGKSKGIGAVLRMVASGASKRSLKQTGEFVRIMGGCVRLVETVNTTLHGLQSVQRNVAKRLNYVASLGPTPCGTKASAQPGQPDDAGALNVLVRSRTSPTWRLQFHRERKH